MTGAAVITVPMTSTDAKDLAKRLRKLERTADYGDSLLAKEIIIDGRKFQFAVDQNRAREQGLMKL